MGRREQLVARAIQAGIPASELSRITAPHIKALLDIHAPPEPATEPEAPPPLPDKLPPTLPVSVPAPTPEEEPEEEEPLEVDAAFLDQGAKPEEERKWDRLLMLQESTTALRRSLNKVRNIYHDTMDGLDAEDRSRVQRYLDETRDMTAAAQEEMAEISEWLMAKKGEALSARARFARRLGDAPDGPSSLAEQELLEYFEARAAPVDLP